MIKKYVQYKMKDLCRLTNISSSCARIWEKRYEWPHPTYGKNGFRYYTRKDVEEVKLALEELKKGKTIGQIIQSGELIVKKYKKPHNIAVPQDLFDLPTVSSESVEICDQLKEALFKKDNFAIIKIIHQIQSLRPGDRDILYRMIILWLSFMKTKDKKHDISNVFTTFNEVKK